MRLALLGPLGRRARFRDGMGPDAIPVFGEVVPRRKSVARRFWETAKALEGWDTCHISVRLAFWYVGRRFSVGRFPEKQTHVTKGPK